MMKTTYEIHSLRKNLARADFYLRMMETCKARYREVKRQQLEPNQVLMNGLYWRQREVMLKDLYTWLNKRFNSAMLDTMEIKQVSNLALHNII